MSKYPNEDVTGEKETVPANKALDTLASLYLGDLGHGTVTVTIAGIEVTLPVKFVAGQTIR